MKRRRGKKYEGKRRSGANKNKQGTSKQTGKPNQRATTIFQHQMQNKQMKFESRRQKRRSQGKYGRREK